MLAVILKLMKLLAALFTSGVSILMIIVGWNTDMVAVFVGTVVLVLTCGLVWYAHKDNRKAEARRSYLAS